VSGVLLGVVARCRPQVGSGWIQRGVAIAGVAPRGRTVTGAVAFRGRGLVRREPCRVMVGAAGN
jgi:hypothetical protein